MTRVIIAATPIYGHVAPLRSTRRLAGGLRRAAAARVRGSPCAPVRGGFDATACHGAHGTRIARVRPTASDRPMA